MFSKAYMARLYCDLFGDLSQKYLLKLYEGTMPGMGKWHVEACRQLYPDDMALRRLLDKAMQSTKGSSNLSSPGPLLFCRLALTV